MFTYLRYLRGTGLHTHQKTLCRGLKQEMRAVIWKKPKTPPSPPTWSLARLAAHPNWYSKFMRNFIVTTGSGFIFTNILHWDLKCCCNLWQEEAGTEGAMLIVLSASERQAGLAAPSCPQQTLLGHQAVRFLPPMDQLNGVLLSVREPWPF